MIYSVQFISIFATFRYGVLYNLLLSITLFVSSLYIMMFMLFTLSFHHIVALSCQCIALCLYRFSLSQFVLCVFPSQFPPYLGFNFTMLFVISHFFSICFLVLQFSLFKITLSIILHKRGTFSCYYYLLLLFCLCLSSINPYFLIYQGLVFFCLSKVGFFLWLNFWEMENLPHKSKPSSL